MNKPTQPVRRKGLQLLALLLGLSLGPLAVAAGTGNISGTVYHQGSPASGARLVVMHDDISHYTGEAYADGSGVYSVAGIPLGAIKIRVYNAASQRIGEQTATLSAPDATVSVDISIN